MKLQIEPRAVKIAGHLIAPGDAVRILAGPRAGLVGNFRGMAAGQLIVRVKFGKYSATLLRLGKNEIGFEGGRDATQRTERAN